MTNQGATSEGTQIVRGTAIVSVLTLLSRVFGFVRELLTARLLGAGFFSDAFFVAFRLPNLLRSFVAEGALTSAFVPLFAERLHKGRDDAARALNNIAGFLLVLTGTISLLGILYAHELVELFGFADDKSELCATLTKIMFPYIMLVSIVALLNGVLNSLKTFGAAAWAQIVTNIVLIIGAAIGFFFDVASAAKILAWSLLIGGVAGVVYQFPALHRANISLRPRFKLLCADTRQLTKLMIPAIFGAAAYQIAIFIATIFASSLREGSVSWLFYADRLAQLPMGVFTVALGTVLLPSLSMAHSMNDQSGFERNLMRSLCFTSVIIMPIATLLFLFAEPLMVLVFEGGRFTRESSINAALALKAMTLGLWAASCHTIAVRGFLARRNTLTPALLGFFSLGLGVVLSLLLMGSPASSEAQGSAAISRIQQMLAGFLPLYSFGHVGLAISSSLAALISFLLLYCLLARKLHAFPTRIFLLASLKAFLATACSVFLIVATELFSLAPWQQIMFGIPLFLLLFVLISLVLGSVEIREALQTAKKLGRLRT